MTDLIQAMVYTIQKFVSMFFTLNIDTGVSIGSFLLATAILGALIRLVFSLIHVPGSKFASNSPGADQYVLEDKGGK